jgi:hypothetical protein
LAGRRSYSLAVVVGLVTGLVIGLLGVHGAIVKPGLTHGQIKVFYGSEARVSFFDLPLHSEFGAKSDEDELSFWVPFYRVVVAVLGGLFGLAAWDIFERATARRSSASLGNILSSDKRPK